MPLPLQLPTIQNWSCHNCGGCCRQHEIEITEAERARIVSQSWTGEAGFPANQSLFQKRGFSWNPRYFLAHRPDGACVFLDENGLCRIHARHGEQAKPLACRIYPYAFHPSGGKITVSLRFSCPSVVGNRGRSLEDQKRELKELEADVVPEGADRISPPVISRHEKLDWGDTLRIVRALDDELASGPDESSSPKTTLVVRLLRTLHWMGLLADAKFDKIRGNRVDEFLRVLREDARGQVPLDPAMIPEPGSLGRTQFRMLAAQYARRDTAAEKQLGWRGRWRLFAAGLRFAKGTGLVPALQSCFREVPFSDLERSFGNLPLEAEEILTRYLRVKVQGLHFCGPAYYGASVAEGWQSQALVVPVTLWIARWLAASENRAVTRPDDVARALSIADHHHGYSPALGGTSARARVRLLAKNGDLPRLIAWYGR